MTPSQYRSALKRLGLSQHGAADLLGHSRRSSQGYALGEYPVPECVAILLRLLLAGKITVADVEGARR